MQQQQHTYLRYECADSFGLVTSVGAASRTRTPPSDATLQRLGHHSLVTTAGSHVMVWNLHTGLPTFKLGPADDDFGGVGTGRALTASQVLCLDTTTATTSNNRIATGWIDGAVRVFDVRPEDLKRSGSTAFSLLQSNDDNDNDDEPVTAERPDSLCLNGHAPSPVTALCLEQDRLASGGSDGTVIVWDLMAESGLYRLLGHQGAITQLHFLTLTHDHTHGVLVSCSLDGLVKLWDLQAQCCVQTLANMRGEVWASTLVSLPTHKNSEDEMRHRLLTGSVDGQVRVWKVQASARQQQQQQQDGDTTTRDKMDTEDDPETAISTRDDVCHDMGLLEAPRQHLATSSSKADTSALATKEKVQSIRYSPYSRHVAILQANSKIIHVYGIRSQKEALRKKQRRLKRRQEKMSKKERDEQDDGVTKGNKRGILDDVEEDDDETMPQDALPPSYDADQWRASDEFEYCGAIQASHKVKAFVFVPVPSKSKKGTTQKTLVQVAAALSTNTIELYSLDRDITPNHHQAIVVSKKNANLTPLYGHPTGVRAICLSSNDDLAATVSKGVCKLWNIAQRSCLLSVVLEPPPASSSSRSNSKATYQGLCAVFLPGNTHVVVGTREGHLLILDTAASQVVYWEEKAHDDAIWSLDLFHTRQQTVSSSDDNDGPTMMLGNTSIVTGGADKRVKFWTLERQGNRNDNNTSDSDSDDSDSDEEEVFVPGAPMVVPTRVLEMTDEVVAVKFSTSQFQNESRRMVFVSTLDCTIKVFFEDTLKLFLSMYGHKLPALAVDASDDDTLLVSGGADKCIKIWGTDFGDCHRTLHGHSDSVTDVRFVRGTHNFFSSSKDGTVRFWDGDRFELILVLRGHSAEINCLAVSSKNNGAFVLSGSMDRSVRVWERTRDIVFLEEERERELERMFDDPKNTRQEGSTANILDRKGRSDDADGNDAEDNEMKQDEPQSEAAVKQSLMSISAGDRLLEGLELADEELQNRRQKSKTSNNASPAFNPMLLGMEPPQYILWVLRSIKSAELEQSLLVLPLGHAERLLYYMVLLLKAGHNSVELCCRVSVFTIKAHQHQVRRCLLNICDALAPNIAMKMNCFDEHCMTTNNMVTKYTQVSEQCLRSCSYN